MKTNFDDFRTSTIQVIIKHLKLLGTTVIIYEPRSNEDSFLDCDMIDDLDTFKRMANIIVANRISEELEDSLNKIYTRDLSGSDY